MLTPPRTLTVGQLHECFKCLKQQPSHLTLSEVSKRSLNTGVSKSSRERADKGQRRRRRPSKTRQREASMASSQSVRHAEGARSKQREKWALGMWSSQQGGQAALREV